MAQSVVSWAALSFGNELFTSSASTLAHGAVGEKNSNGGRSGGLLGAVKTVIKGLRNAQTSTFRGIANTYDAAKEGGFIGAVEHAASHIPVVNNLVSAAKSGKMRNYVAASFVFGSDSDRAARYLENDAPEMHSASNPNNERIIFMPDNISLDNPYLSARKEYGDRYGSAVKDAARWRQISIFMVMLCLVFGALMM
ncbi:MAG: hypothetical protein IJT21_00595 [Synergistaceae bacterium]|nr:hypothetical protein [Synergistaceae bacterium]